MIERTLTARVLSAAADYPVVTVTGPRQAGKTTLCRAAFPERPYANLEHPGTRSFAREDPEGFLRQFEAGAIIDEVQRAPDLLSYIQVLVDETPQPGRFVLTGSQHLGLVASVSQSLAGRTALLNLLPLGVDELRRGGVLADDPFRAILTGGFPRIHDRGLEPDDWLGSYTSTYLERDVRQVVNVGNLAAFQAFLQLAAGRVGQMLNLSGLGADCGISHTTARSWLSVLEAGFVVFRLRPMHRNLGKRLTKSPKIYFHDSGLLCHLLGIRTREQLRLHPLRGAIFESWAISEVLKSRVHRGRRPDMFFFRDHRGQEVDLVLESGLDFTCAEIKAGQTVTSSFFKTLRRLRTLLETADPPATSVRDVLVYAGEDRQDRSDVTVLPWSAIDRFEW